MQAKKLLFNVSYDIHPKFIFINLKYNKCVKVAFLKGTMYVLILFSF